MEDFTKVLPHYGGNSAEFNQRFNDYQNYLVVFINMVLT